jgi:hypothetical protein
MQDGDKKEDKGGEIVAKAKKILDEVNPKLNPTP